ncbi:MAG: OsmC family protein [Acidobacteriaceae bacterium]
MKASATWKPTENSPQEYDSLSDSNHTVHLDAGPGHAAGPSPMELVLMGLCGCTSVDVTSILKKKREPITGLTVSAVAEQATESPRVFTHIQLVYRVSGNVSHKGLEDAVQLSKSKYCSVSRMLDKTATIEHVLEFEKPQACESPEPA